MKKFFPVFCKVAVIDYFAACVVAKVVSMMAPYEQQAQVINLIMTICVIALAAVFIGASIFYGVRYLIEMRKSVTA